MTSVERPKVFGAGLITLDLVMGMAPNSPVRSWAGGTCGNVLSILAYLGWEAYPITRMNGDPASERVRADMARWGVRMDFASCSPTSHTPIIIQEIRRGRDGSPTHRFSWSCPRCGQWLPRYKAVTVAAIDIVTPSLPGISVFFLDRLSRATVTLATRAAAEGAVVVFEPSGKADPKLFAETIRIAHVVKYADQRLTSVGGVMEGDAATLIEIQTLGAKGLRYRHRFGRRASDWVHLNAVSTPNLADTCGAGDWCTAGLIAKATLGGQVGLRHSGAEGVRDALRYGQTLAAWNCGFEGARGAMYAVDQNSFDHQLETFSSGQHDIIVADTSDDEQDTAIACPACPQCLPQGSQRRRTLSRPAKSISAA